MELFVGGAATLALAVAHGSLLARYRGVTCMPAGPRNPAQCPRERARRADDVIAAIHSA
jgi:hypothetical protein